MKTGIGPAEPIGIYRTPSPPEAAPQIRSVELAPIGVVPAAYLTEKAVNYIYRKAVDVLSHL